MLLTLRRRDDRGAKGFRGGLLGWGGGALRGRLVDSAFAGVDCGPTAVVSPLSQEEGGSAGSDREWVLTVCGGSSSSDDDAYASIPGGRLADITSGASSPEPESESTSEPKRDTSTIDARCALDRGSVSLAVGNGDGWV